MINRGEIYWVNLNPTIGSEIKKTRPALVISNDINNLHAQTITVLPMTTATNKVYPFDVLIKTGAYGNQEPSKVKANQIRTVDKRRLGKLLGMLPADIMGQVEKALRLHLGI